MISSSRSSGRRDVDDGVVGPLAAHREGGRDARLAELRPARWPVEARSARRTPERPSGRADARELAGVEPAELGLTARGGEAGPLVREAEGERDRGRVRVGVDETDVPAAARELDGELDRDGRSPGRAGRAPHGDDRRRARRRAGGVRRRPSRRGRRSRERARRAARPRRRAAAAAPGRKRRRCARPTVLRRAARSGTALRSHSATTRGGERGAVDLEHDRVGVGERRAACAPRRRRAPRPRPPAARADAATTATHVDALPLEALRERAVVRVRRPRRATSHRAAPAVRHDRERRLVGHRGERGGDIRSRDHELERGRAAADHGVVPRHRDDRGVGDEDAGHVVVAALEQRRRPDLDDACPPRPTPGTSTRAAHHDARGAHRAPRRRPRCGRDELAGVDGAGRDESVGERVGCEVRIADLAERRPRRRRDRRS